MKIDKALISKLEKLSKLQLSEAEQEKLGKDLEKILSMIDKLNEIDTDGIEPLIYLNSETNVWRKDEVHHPITREEALKNAPAKNEEYFIVPKVIPKQ